MPENEHAINALVRKRAELAGKIEACQDELQQAIIDLDNVDHCIRLFDPDIDLEDISPRPLPPSNQAFKGEMTRIILEALRNSPDPLHSRQLTSIVLDRRGLGSANKRLRSTMQKRVSASLRAMKRRGRLDCRKGAEGLLVWWIVRESA